MPLQVKMLIYQVVKLQLLLKQMKHQTFQLLLIKVSETIVLQNTQGTNEGFIKLNSLAGGVDIDAAAR